MLGLTQTELAESLDIALRTVQLYEKRGAPVFYRYALAGLRMEKAGFLAPENLLGPEPAGEDSGGGRGNGGK